MNYEPNSWGPVMGGPREDPERGIRSFAADGDGLKQRLRRESFADHYSQARQFYVSQGPIEQKHIGDALVFELSKVERPDIRIRIVSHLRNIDPDLAQTVANGLAVDLPDPAQAAMPTRQDLAPSPALYDALVEAVTAAGGLYEVVAPNIGGVVLSDGSALAAKYKVDGGSSVLFDAVAVIPSAEGAQLLAGDGPTRDFVSDAFVHCKFIGLSEGGVALMAGAGLGAMLDEGCVTLNEAADSESFVAACAPLRYWPRELDVDADAASASG